MTAVTFSSSAAGAGLLRAGLAARALRCLPRLASAWGVVTVALALALALVLALLASQPQLRADLEARALAWLLERQSASLGVAVDPAAAGRVTVADPRALPTEQERVANWLSRKYRVAKEPMSALVAEAYAVGAELRLDPKLILAVMAKESRFNPFAASPVGAQGLMQVMTRVHSAKLEDFGGKLAVFDPLTNLRVGALILRDTIRRGGSVEAGLRLYVGAVTTDASAYIHAVLSERERLQRVAQGQRVGFNAGLRRSSAADAPMATAAPDSAAPAAAAIQGAPGVLPQAAPLPPDVGATPEPAHSGPLTYSRLAPGAAYAAYAAAWVERGIPGSAEGRQASAQPQTAALAS